MSAAPFDYSWDRQERRMRQLESAVTSVRVGAASQLQDLRSEIYGRFGEHCKELQMLNDLCQQYDALERRFLPRA